MLRVSLFCSIFTVSLLAGCLSGCSTEFGADNVGNVYQQQQQDPYANNRATDQRPESEKTNSMTGDESDSHYQNE
jgi:hypothetical protein